MDAVVLIGWPEPGEQQLSEQLQRLQIATRTYNHKNMRMTTRL